MDQAQQILAQEDFPGTFGRWIQANAFSTKGLTQEPQTSHPIKTSVAIDVSDYPSCWISPLRQLVREDSWTGLMKLGWGTQAQSLMRTKVIILSTPSV